MIKRLSLAQGVCCNQISFASIRLQRFGLWAELSAQLRCLALLAEAPTGYQNGWPLRLGVHYCLLHESCCLGRSQPCLMSSPSASC